jgi:hypothetical protein
MMAVKIDTEPALRSSLPVELWRRRYWSQEFLSPNYDVAPDGRFLMLQITNDRVDAPRSVNVVLNWFDELKRLVPAR